MLMAAANDQDEILDLVNTTEAYLLSKVRFLIRLQPPQEGFSTLI